MPRADPSIVWLSADVPRDVGDTFAMRSQQLHRSSRGQLKELIARFLEECDERDRARDRGQLTAA